MPWILLALAISTEIAATTALKASEGFSRLWPSVVVVVGYVASFVLLARALKTLDVGVAYAIWSGVGTAVVAALGVLLFAESMSLMKAVWIAVIIVGVIGLQATSGGAH
ncbi:MAG TPA: multidrug efflux SMR transporter [Actinomycetales bacterium]|nr:multidrug efflux SMR transporter [Actinomycetales bacterium]